jgi:hypothetical protein
MPSGRRIRSCAAEPHFIDASECNGDTSLTTAAQRVAAFDFETQYVSGLRSYRPNTARIEQHWKRTLTIDGHVHDDFTAFDRNRHDAAITRATRNPRDLRRVRGHLTCSGAGVTGQDRHHGGRRDYRDQTAIPCGV